MGRTRSVVVLLAIALLVRLPAAQHAERPAPILILVSFDGWRWDYAERYGAPNLRALAERGARAERMIPSFPVLTFPNHNTIVTGLYPEHHGIVANVMIDPSLPERFTMSSATAKDVAWWQAEPLWVTAIRQGRRAAAMFWPGTDVAIGGVRPTFWKPYDKNFHTPARVAQVLEWLALPEDERPAFVSLYFDEVDSTGHDFGPDSPELVAATQHLDAALGDIVAGLARMHLADRTTIVTVSDHGMAQLSTERVVYLDDYLDPATVDILESGGVLLLAPKDGDVDAVYARLHGRHPALTIYKRDEVPERLHYRGNPRIAPIVGIPREGWAVTTRAKLAEKPLQKGAHGFDPRDRSMGALFVAAGPGMPRGLVLEPFANVDVYNLLCGILHLAPMQNDGGPLLLRRLGVP